MHEADDGKMFIDSGQISLSYDKNVGRTDPASFHNFFLATRDFYVSATFGIENGNSNVGFCRELLNFLGMKDDIELAYDEVDKNSAAILESFLDCSSIIKLGSLEEIFGQREYDQIIDSLNYGKALLLYDKDIIWDSNGFICFTSEDSDAEEVHLKTYTTEASTVKIFTVVFQNKEYFYSPSGIFKAANGKMFSHPNVSTFLVGFSYKTSPEIEAKLLEMSGSNYKPEAYDKGVTNLSFCEELISYLDDYSYQPKGEDWGPSKEALVEMDIFRLDSSISIGTYSVQLICYELPETAGKSFTITFKGKEYLFTQSGLFFTVRNCFEDIDCSEGTIIFEQLSHKTEEDISVFCSCIQHFQMQNIEFCQHFLSFLVGKNFPCEFIVEKVIELGYAIEESDCCQATAVFDALKSPSAIVIFFTHLEEEVEPCEETLI